MSAASPESGRISLALLAAVTVMLVLGVAVWAGLGTRLIPPTQSPIEAETAAVPSPPSAAAKAAGSELAQIAAPQPIDLDPLLGDPREFNAEFCDTELWSGIESIVEEIREGAAVVDQAQWERHSTNARIGLASWISKCRFTGGGVQLLGNRSLELLARYDSELGYRGVE